MEVVLDANDLWDVMNPEHEFGNRFLNLIMIKIVMGLFTHNKEKIHVFLFV